MRVSCAFIDAPTLMDWHTKRPKRVLLVGCKADFERAVTTEEIHALADERGVAYIEVSANTNQGCLRLFPYIHQRIVASTEPAFPQTMPIELCGDNGRGDWVYKPERLARFVTWGAPNVPVRDGDDRCITRMCSILGHERQFLGFFATDCHARCIFSEVRRKIVFAQLALPACTIDVKMTDWS